MPDPALTFLRATIHYDGTGFRGWQLQPGERTVQGEFESALSKLTARAERILAAGRTDTGVHAVGQEIAFHVPASRSVEEVAGGLGAHLPDDIFVSRISLAADGFHPRFDASARRYEYLIGDEHWSASPILRSRVWAPRPRARGIEMSSLEEAARALYGKRSFGAFAKSGQPERGTICDILRASWDRTPTGLLRFTIVADRFLHRMVRYLVATLVEVATGRRDAAELGRLLAEEIDEVRPPVPAPAHGLYLSGVRYVEGWNRAAGIPGLAPSEPEG